MNFQSPIPEELRTPAEVAVTSLAMAEMFALWAIRIWVCAYRGGGNLLPQLRQGFVLAGMPRAWLELDEFMTRLLGSVKRPLDIRTVSSAHASSDEHGMLRWLAELQHGDRPPSDCAHLTAIAAPGAKLARSFAMVHLHFRAEETGSLARNNLAPSLH